MKTVLLNEASPYNSRVKKVSYSFYNIGRKSDFLEGDELRRSLYVWVSVIEERSAEKDRGVRERKGHCEVARW